MTYLPATRSARIGLAVGAAVVLFGGAALYVQCAFDLRSFGGIEYVPRVLTLSILRESGAGGASTMACLFVTGSQHDLCAGAGRGVPPGWRSRVSLGAQAVLLTVLLYAPACAVLLVGGVALASARDGLGPHAFSGIAKPSDAAAGLLMAFLLGALPAVWTLFGSRVWKDGGRLTRKLVLTLATLWGVNISIATVSALLGLILSQMA